MEKIGNHRNSEAGVQPSGCSENKLKLELQRKLKLGLQLGAVLCLLSGCTTAPRPGAFTQRTGDEIVIAGNFVHTGTPVVLWMDPGGYDAYRVERRFAPFDQSSWETSHVA